MSTLTIKRFSARADVKKALVGLNGIAIHALRRAGRGEVVECTRWRRGAPEMAFLALLQKGLMTQETTPKGRKHFLVLTELGKLSVEVIREWDTAETDKRLEKAKEEQRAPKPWVDSRVALPEDSLNDKYGRIWVVAVDAKGRRYPSEAPAAHVRTNPGIFLYWAAPATPREGE